MSNSQFVNSPMQAEVFRGFVGRQIFCSCGQVLDVASATGIDLRVDGRLFRSMIFCSACIERRSVQARADHLRAGLVAGHDHEVTMEVTSGWRRNRGVVVETITVTTGEE